MLFDWKSHFILLASLLDFFQVIARVFQVRDRGPTQGGFFPELGGQKHLKFRRKKLMMLAPWLPMIEPVLDDKLFIFGAKRSSWSGVLMLLAVRMHFCSIHAVVTSTM